MTLPGTPYDVIVVGAGNAALCAALAAREHGASVLVLEKAPEHLRGGNTYFTGGGYRFPYRGLDDIRDKLKAGDVRPQRFERIGRRTFETHHVLAMSHEEFRVARSILEWEWIVGMIVDRRIELANDVRQYRFGDDEPAR